MKRIVLVDQTLEPGSLVVNYAIGMARKEEAKLYVVSMFNPDADHTYWIAIQDLLEKELRERLETKANTLVATAKAQGVEAQVLVTGGHPQEAVRDLVRDERCDLLIIGDLESLESGSTYLSPEAISRLSSDLVCPVITAEAIRDRYQPFPKREAASFVVLIGAVGVTYATFFTHFDQLKKFLFGATLPAALAILVFVPLVAYLYGTAANNLLKMLKFEPKH